MVSNDLIQRSLDPFADESEVRICRGESLTSTGTSSGAKRRGVHRGGMCIESLESRCAGMNCFNRGQVRSG